MAITESVGYEGTVGYDTYSQTVTQAGRYTVDGAGAWKVSAVTGDRTVRVAAGVGKGYGISDTATDTDLQHDIALSGVRYDLVVAHRDWSTSETEFQIINGGSTATLPSRTTGPGAADDQPLALVRITAGETDPVVVADLRCWAGDGGLVATDVLALDYLGEIPGTRVSIGALTYTRVLTAAGAAYWVIDGRRGETLAAHVYTPPANPGLTASTRLIDRPIPADSYDRVVEVVGAVNVTGTTRPWRVVVTSAGSQVATNRQFEALLPWAAGAATGGSVPISATFDLPASAEGRVGIWVERVDSGVLTVAYSTFKIRVRAKG